MKSRDFLNIVSQSVSQSGRPAGSSTDRSINYMSPVITKISMVWYDMVWYVCMYVCMYVDIPCHSHPILCI